MKIAIVIIIGVILAIIYNTRKYTNLMVILSGITVLLIDIMMIVICIICMILIVITHIPEIFIISLMVIFITVVTILLTKENISLGIITTDYLIKRKKIYKFGIRKKGKICDIKKISFSEDDESIIRYYLIVEVDGKQIKSLCFTGKNFSVGNFIDVIYYKNKHYIIL